MAGNKRWSQKEIDLLKTYYSITSIEEISEKLPNRSIDAIHKKASDLKIAFSPDEENLIFSKLEEICKKVDRIEKFIYGLKKSYWTKEEDDYLTENYQKKSIKEIAMSLSRTKASVQNRKALLNLTRPKTKPIRNPEFDLKLKELYYKATYKEIAKELNIGQASLSRFIRELKDEGVITKRKRNPVSEDVKKYKGKKIKDVVIEMDISERKLRSLLSYVELNVVGGIIIDKEERTPLNKISVSLENVDEVAQKYHYTKREILRYLKSKSDDTKRKNKKNS